MYLPLRSISIEVYKKQTSYIRRCNNWTTSYVRVGVRLGV